MIGRPVVITSLEEDLKKLGLISEEGPEKAAPKGEPSTSSAAPGRNVGALSDKPEEKGKDTTDKAPDHEGAKLPAAKLPVTPGAQKEAVSGMPDAVRAGKGAGKGKVVDDSPDATTSKQSTAEAKDDDGDDDEDDKDDEKKDDDKEEAISVRDAIARVRGESKSLDAVSSLLSGVSEIMESIDDSHRADSVKAFANVSIIAEMLHRGYASYAGRFEDEELAEAAETLGLMAQEAHDIALALESGENVDEGSLAEEFAAQMEALIAGLDLYSDIFEAVREMDEASDDDEDEDDEDDKKKKDDDEDDKEEAVLIRSPLVKKDKMKGGGMSASTGARSAAASTPGMRLNMSKEEAYMPFGKPMGKAKKPGQK